MSAFEEDQFAAAAEEIRLRVHRAAAANWPGGSQTVECPAGPFTNELIAGMVELLDRGALQQCGHLSAPGVSFLLSWMPEGLACEPCAAGATATLLSQDPPGMCSACGHRRIVGTMLAGAGPLAVLLALCENCANSEAVTT